MFSQKKEESSKKRQESCFLAPKKQEKGGTKNRIFEYGKNPKNKEKKNKEN